MKIYQSRGEVETVWDDNHEKILWLETDVKPPTPTSTVKFIEWPGTAYGTVYVTWIDSGDA